MLLRWIPWGSLAWVIIILVKLKIQLSHGWKFFNLGQMGLLLFFLYIFLALLWNISIVTSLIPPSKTWIHLFLRAVVLVLTVVVVETGCKERVVFKVVVLVSVLWNHILPNFVVTLVNHTVRQNWHFPRSSAQWRFLKRLGTHFWFDFNVLSSLVLNWRLRDGLCC